MDLCTGGELFDEICQRGHFFEKDAKDIIAVIADSVSYLHSTGIVHRDLKPENLLFRNDKATPNDLCVADFGLSKIIESGKFTQLYQICGTVGYMAPEVFMRVGHGFPVDIWAIGVITFFLLSGTTPFDRGNQKEEINAILDGNYKFEPAEYWNAVSETAKDFIKGCMNTDPAKRLTAKQVLEHPWLKGLGEKDEDLLPNVRRAFDAKRSCQLLFSVIILLTTQQLELQFAQCNGSTDYAAWIVQKRRKKNIANRYLRYSRKLRKKYSVQRAKSLCTRYPQTRIIY